MFKIEYKLWSFYTKTTPVLRSNYYNKSVILYYFFIVQRKYTWQTLTFSKGTLSATIWNKCGCVDVCVVCACKYSVVIYFASRSLYQFAIMKTQYLHTLDLLVLYFFPLSLTTLNLLILVCYLLSTIVYPAPSKCVLHQSKDLCLSSQEQCLAHSRD